MTMETPEFEDESLKLRVAFEEIMVQILTFSIEEIEPLRAEVAWCQKHFLERLHDFRKLRHTRTMEPPARSSDSSTPTSRSHGSKIKIEMPSFNGEPTE